jgi:CHAD domain-containing protein
MTGSSSRAAYPVRTLREHVTALEAAVTVCLADPKPKPVHHLRTATRRIEGQLALLGTMSGMPDHDKAARRVRRILKKLRRAAGEVRDLDVQMELIDSIASSSSARSLQHDSSRLHERLEAGREKAAGSLVKLLHRRGADVAGMLESLLDALRPAESVAISPAQLMTLARDWFAQNAPQELHGNLDDPDQLHAVRKTAKLARYIAENAPKSAVQTRRLADAFESVQEAGGRWHDWLVLAAVANDKLGASSPLTMSFTRRCHSALAAYRRRLDERLA